MVSRRLLFAATILCLLVGVLGVVLYGRQRADRCAYVPLLAPELLPNADLRIADSSGDLPEGWGRGPGASVRYGAFTVLPGGKSLQLIGIATYVQTPVVVLVRSGWSYCFQAQAITDSERGLPTRLRVVFQWLDSAGNLLSENRTPWQQAIVWQQDAPPAGWSVIEGAFVAPKNAVSLRVRVAPSSDERVYLDQMHLRAGGAAVAARVGVGQPLPPPQVDSAVPVQIWPWPNGKRAALSFSFDWETAMGGLIHSRSLGDPHADQDFLLRGMRMREGVTTTLDIFRPYGIRATYYATGYNFLLGNAERRMFMGNPTFAWATAANRWISGRWPTMPWFADDPYGTVASDPAWYFGDLIPKLKAERQDLQSHTFSHLYGGFATTREWQADIDTWREVAAEAGVAPARSLAFPWSGSGGMSDATWEILERAGIRSVTRLSDQAQYRMVSDESPHCVPVPGHERILACPDFYLTIASAEIAKERIDRTLVLSGTLDLWAHTEEVTAPEQIAAWRDVVSYAASKPDLWIAPLAEITDWQAALAGVRIERRASHAAVADKSVQFAIINSGEHDVQGVGVQFPFIPQKVVIDGRELTTSSLSSKLLLFDLPAGKLLEVQIWPE